MKEKKTTCSVCNINPNASNKRMCKRCHATYMRHWRKTHPLSVESKKLASVRAYSRTLEKRGRFNKIPCQICNDVNSERHHPEPKNPHKIIYLCRSHHLLHHQGWLDISHLKEQISLPLKAKSRA